MSKSSVSRRSFMGGTAAALGYMGLNPRGDLSAKEFSLDAFRRSSQEFDFDSYARLSSNENAWAPSESVLDAVTASFKYANRYGDPGEDIVAAIAERDGVEENMVLTTPGSGALLRVVGTTFLGPNKKVVGVEPTYSSVYRHASGLKADVIALSLNADATQNIDRMIETTRKNYRDVGLVYLVNPNNPTGITVDSSDVQKLLDGIPDDVPVLIDEAYHHFVQNPNYSTAIPHVLEGRPVIVARTFSKIYGMAAIRLGYGIASPEMIDKMRPYQTGNVSVLARWGGVAALKDTESEATFLKDTLDLRNKTVSELEAMGHRILPTETNFFFVYTGRPVSEVQEAFRQKGVLVGRPFPPMLDYLRVSIGTAEEMDRFMVAWKEIFPATAADSL